MTLSPGGPPGGPPRLWRLVRAAFADSWDSGQGAFEAGGRWNSVGTRAVYGCLDPATAILEVAVHAGFAALDTIRHVMIAADIVDLVAVHVVDPCDVPNPRWLHPGPPSAGQQQFGDALLSKHAMVALPSAVSVHSWNLLMRPGAGVRLHLREAFALDTRLHPPISR